MRSKTLISLLLLAVIYVMAGTNVPFFKSKKKGTDSKHPIENNDSTNNNSTDSIPLYNLGVLDGKTVAVMSTPPPWTRCKKPSICITSR